MEGTKLAEYQDEIVIVAPPREVYAWTSDLDVLSRVQSNVVSARSSGPLQEGSPFVVTLGILGRTHDVDVHVTRLVEDSTVRMTTTVPLPPSMTLKVTLQSVAEPHEEGTRLLGWGEFVFSRGFARLAENMLVAMGRREMRRSFERLKELVEAGPRRTA